MKVEIISFEKDKSVDCRVLPYQQVFTLHLNNYELSKSAIGKLRHAHGSECHRIAKTITAMITDAPKELPPIEFEFSEVAKLRKYGVYFKDFSKVDEADVYQVHHTFNMIDPSGCKHHASKKILLSGVRTGGKDEYKDIEEARDTLNRWLEINKAS